jgi:hypothetical protein
MSGGPRVLAERPVQLKGSWLARRILEWMGWQVDFAGLPALQGVIAVYPHTSNWDFPLGLLAKWALGLKIVFWGKASLFKPPIFGAWMRWLGGVPVDRSTPKGVVGDMVQRMQTARERGEMLWLVLAPEGTRSLVPGWRSGFYNVCVGAGVPVALAHFDFASKRIGISTCLQLSGEREADMAEIAKHIGWAKGYRPELAAPITLT